MCFGCLELDVAVKCYRANRVRATVAFLDWPKALTRGSAIMGSVFPSITLHIVTKLIPLEFIKNEFRDVQKQRLFFPSRGRLSEVESLCLVEFLFCS